MYSQNFLHYFTLISSSNAFLWLEQLFIKENLVKFYNFITRLWKIKHSTFDSNKIFLDFSYLYVSLYLQTVSRYDNYTLRDLNVMNNISKNLISRMKCSKYSKRISTSQNTRIDFNVAKYNILKYPEFQSHQDHGRKLQNTMLTLHSLFSRPM